MHTASRQAAESSFDAVRLQHVGGLLGVAEPPAWLDGPLAPAGCSPLSIEQVLQAPPQALCAKADERREGLMLRNDVCQCEESNKVGTMNHLC